ncbi:MULTISPECIES: YcaO-like family protein [Streptomyces]|uniref:YcaO-like family protein n=1 Tax=Streptomyces TaxID=1883 RepID=UPI000241B303|nr:MULTISPECIES: YcaO-like family protein [Streptomyces]EHM25907.1 YcaO protein [Streptomyces sp. W007]MCX4485145.1 YcaO-like family protein [Streptomyces anulatus]MCX4518793.1 YcaO-like family protein [Streptomyces anulatus]MCX4601673.1 YcaO-like family protein [Streptomyces anulatus]WSU74055.1 YcaO-like family protein [Streptomyces anulatus]
MELSLKTIESAATPKGHKDGTDRLVPPSETLERVRPHFAEAGLTRVANVTGLDVVGTPVVLAVRPNSRSLAVHQGKGLTLDAAKASAVMESLERWHAENITLPLRLGTPREMARSGPVLDLDRHHLFRGEAFQDRRFLWVEGRELLGDTPVWVPHDLVTLDLRSDGFDVLGPATVPPWSNSNGLASGNHPVEALTHALCELVERDSFIRGTGRAPENGVDLATVDDPACRKVLENFRSAGLDVSVRDLTTDLAIPTFACHVGEDPATAHIPLPVNSGWGTHLRSGIALLRALTEAAQTRLTFISGARDDIGRTVYDSHRDRLRLHTKWNKSRRLRCSRSFQETPSHAHETFEEDVLRIVDALRSRGETQIVVVDLTKQHIGIPVLKVIVPSLLAPAK